MRSRADVRRIAEWVLRGAMLALLVLALWRSLEPASESRVTRGVRASDLASSIPAIVASPDVRAADVTMDAMPARAERDALVALRRAGVTVRWSGVVPAIAIEAVRAREPDARARIMVSAADTAALSLADSAGLLDSVRAKGGATVDAASVVGEVRASQGRFSASSRAPDPTDRRAVLVLGQPNWESRFVMQALGEAGWPTHARIIAAPGVAVTDAALLPIDTSRYDVVVALDTSAADLAPAVARFVSQGGGLIAAGTALDVGAFRALVPARAGERRVGRILLAEDTVTPRDLPVRPLAVARDDALTLAREAGGITVAARRAGAGRVIAVGYDESWRWRMLGGITGVDAHRRWWSRAAGAVAPERVQGASVSGANAAPVAALYDALGAPAAAVASNASRSPDALPLVLLVLIATSLLAEIASRRFRGAR